MPLTRTLFSSLVALAACAGHAAAQQELFEWIASDGDSVDEFGNSVSVSGDRALIGAHKDEANGFHSGSAYLFDVTSGAELLKLTPADAMPGDRFGWAVALGADRAVIGASFRNEVGFDSGAAYVFDVSTGQQLHKLVASDEELHDRFGFAVAIAGDRVAVSSPRESDLGPEAGAVYLFDLTTGQELFKLNASDAGAGDRFGEDLSMDDSRLLVGAPGADEPEAAAGAAYLFDVATGAELAKLVAPDGAFNDVFGLSVALAGDRLVIASPTDDDGGSDTGSVHVFDAASGQHLWKLWPSCRSAGDRFGASLSASDGRILVGARRADGLVPDSGAATLFDVATGRQLNVLLAPDGQQDDFFGEAASIDGPTIVVGAENHGHPTIAQGAAYLFSVPQSAGSLYCFGDGGGAACPCGNQGGLGSGCRNSGGCGATLSSGGSTSVAPDDLQLFASFLRPGQPALLFVGEDLIAGGQGSPLGDGLRCAGFGVVRLGVELPDAAARAQWGPGLGALGGWVAGDTRYFQAWYRDPSGPCGSTFNLTNGARVAFAP